MSAIQITPATTATKAWAELSRVFREAGLESPVIDSRLLVCHVLGLDRLGLLREPHRLLADHAEALAAAAQRRLAHEPVSRIIGQRAFWGRPFKISPATLDPRPDSETLIAAALELAVPIQLARAGAPLRLLDLGTGTGCLLLTLLAELPTAIGIGIDCSPEALTVAHDNAISLGLAERAQLLLGDWGAGLAGRFDLIVSNPPYIRHDDLAGLTPDVVNFDPALALDGGADGLSAYRAIVATLPQLQSPGAVLLEVGQGQADAVQHLLQQAFAGATGAVAKRWRDLSEVERVVGFAT